MISLIQNCFRYPLRQLLKLVRNSLDPSVSPFLTFAPPGHFYSPIPNLKDSSNPDVLSDPGAREKSGLDFRDADQVALLNRMAGFYPELPFSDGRSDATRYFFENTWFKAGDAVVLYGLLRAYRPKRIIEIGSGFSSALMLDVNDLFLDHSVRLSFIEPDPARLRSILRKRDLRNVDIMEMPVQKISPDFFHELDGNDILFIDSSHVVKLGSDVNHLLFNILPLLKPGVLVQFHDIRWPFEYPRYQTDMGIAWNEAYFLRAFLMFNSQFKIHFFNSYMAEFHRDLLNLLMPRFMEWPGGSIWIQRV